jgi:hypothetical protein
MLKRLAVALLSVLGMPPVALAQTSVPPVFVYASINSTDANINPIGRQVFLELKEAIRASKTLQLIDKRWYREARDERDEVAYIRVAFHSMPISEKTQAFNAIAVNYDAKSIDLNGEYIDSSMNTCGAKRVTECAEQLLKIIIDNVGWLREHFPEKHRTLLRR